MSKKRTSAESNNDEQTNDGTDLAVFQPDDNAKRPRLALTVSETTLQHLPVEILECILIKVIAMEVTGMKLAKSVWKEKADLVISRLRAVCSHWSTILTTNFFRNELHRYLDRMAQATIRMDILHQSPIQLYVFKATTLKDEIFVRSWADLRIIIVYDRNNMTEVKAVIPLRGMVLVDIAACIISNCVYVLGQGLNTKCDLFSVSRITKDEERQFNISPWISDLRPSYSILSVSANGNLIILWSKRALHPAAVSIYNANGSLQHKIMLSSHIYDLRLGANVLQKSNGNLVLVSHNDQRETLLTEIATSGNIVCQYQSTLGDRSAVNFADIHGRIVISDPSNRIELLDSELNLLYSTGAQLNAGLAGQFGCRYILHYNSEKNEVVGVYSQNARSVLTIFRFTEE